MVKSVKTSGIEILVGCDPEVFLKKGETLVSAHDLLSGTKREPHFVRNGAVQVDGVAAEFNIFPAKTEEEFIWNIRSVMGQMLSMIQSKDLEVSFAIQPTAFFEPEYFFSLPEETLALGCEPDFSAYTMEANPKPHTDEPFRTGSFHIHIGWTRDENEMDDHHFALCGEVVRALDETLYKASLKWDSDEKRRELYGKMGSFRPKHYGVEYRPLSNMVLSDEEVIRYVYREAVSVTRRVLSESLNYKIIEKRNAA